MEFGNNGDEAIPELYVDGLIYALGLVDDSRTLEHFLFTTIPIHYPDRLTEVYQRLVEHADPRMRETAAIGIEHVLIADEDAGLRLARRLLEDDNPDIVQQVRESVIGAAGDEQLPATTLVKFDALCSEYGV